mmetsp:Transcript_8722/g.16073  ORF Transcript_8722/g.16073 Transcript_8722/m.16073 type:complete len:444 (+) Transcript_8722:1-1332(+)
MHEYLFPPSDFVKEEKIDWFSGLPVVENPSISAQLGGASVPSQIGIVELVEKLPAKVRNPGLTLTSTYMTYAEFLSQGFDKAAEKLRARNDAYFDHPCLKKCDCGITALSFGASMAVGLGFVDKVCARALNDRALSNAQVENRLRSVRDPKTCIMGPWQKQLMDHQWGATWFIIPSALYKVDTYYKAKGESRIAIQCQHRALKKLFNMKPTANTSFELTHWAKKQLKTFDPPTGWYSYRKAVSKEFGKRLYEPRKVNKKKVSQWNDPFLRDLLDPSIIATLLVGITRTFKIATDFFLPFTIVPIIEKLYGMEIVIEYQDLKPTSMTFYSLMDTVKGWEHGLTIDGVKTQGQGYVRNIKRQELTKITDFGDTPFARTLQPMDYIGKKVRKAGDGELGIQKVLSGENIEKVLGGHLASKHDPNKGKEMYSPMPASPPDHVLYGEY